MMRTAMSMIELVISIVVMGIVVASLPLILLQSQENNAFAMQQEAIMAAKTKIGDILTYQWDENSYQTFAGGGGYTAILDVAGSPFLDRDTGTRRVGHIEGIQRRKFFTATINPTGAIDGLDDIDDFTGNAEVTRIDTIDYIFDLNLSTTVSYISDAATYSDSNITDFTFTTVGVGPTNLKMVETTVTSAGTNMNIILRAYAANIGETKLLRRDFP